MGPRVGLGMGAVVICGTLGFVFCYSGGKYGIAMDVPAVTVLLPDRAALGTAGRVAKEPR